MPFYSLNEVYPVNATYESGGNQKEVTIYAFKKQVKIKSKEFALEELMKLKLKHSKMENLEYTDLKGVPPNNFLFGGTCPSK